MKKCDGVKKLLSRYVDKETNGADTALVEAHIQGCPSCREEMLEFLRVKKLVSGKEQKVFPRDYMVFRLRQEISAGQRAETGFSWFFGMADLSRRLIPVPVTVVLVSFLFLVFGSGNSLNGRTLEEAILNGDSATIETAAKLILGTEG